MLSRALNRNKKKKNLGTSDLLDVGPDMGSAFKSNLLVFTLHLDSIIVLWVLSVDSSELLFLSHAPAIYVILKLIANVQNVLN